MKKIKFIVCLTMLLYAYNGNAQNSGYLGKKFMIAASLQANTNELILRNEYDNSAFELSSPVKYYLDPKSSFYAGYIVSRRVIVGLDVNINKLTHAVIMNQLDYQGGGAYMTTDVTAESILKTRLIGLNVKVFKSSAALAPIGVYTEYTAGSISYDLIDEEGVMGEKNKSLSSGSGFYIGAGIGRQQMLFKYVNLNIGFDFKLLSTLLTAMDKEPVYKEYTFGNGDINIMEVQPAMKTVYSYSFNAKIGLGFMIF